MFPLRFIVARRIRDVAPIAQEVVVALARTGWDDYGYRLMFKLSVAVDGQAFVDVGEWKILNSKGPALCGTSIETELPKTFDELSEGFVSLGQNLASYQKLLLLGQDLALRILAGLRDVVAVEPSDSVRAHDGFDKALTRFPPARQVFAARHELRSHSTMSRELPGDIRFEVSCKLSGFESPHRMTLAFSRREASLGLDRVAAIVGRNGTGKTRLLAALAQTLSGLKREAEIQPLPDFRRVIAVSYGAWDHFARPRGEGDRIPYVYCGLRADADDKSGERVIDVGRAQEQAIEDLSVISKAPKLRDAWLRAMRTCGLDGEPLLEAIGHASESKKRLSHRSSGEQVATIVVTRLVLHVIQNTLVLFDEPEVHTHPHLLSGLLRALNELLVERDAFALLATHSPIPLQEIPANAVFVVDLVEDHPTIVPLSLQTFGASLDDIVAMAFRTRQDERNWASFVRAHVKEGKSADEIIRALGDSPSLGVRLLLAAMETDERDDAADV